MSYVVFDGLVTDIEGLGNFTYGILGSWYGIELSMLYTGSYIAAKCPTGDALFHEQFEDWPYIYVGFYYGQYLEYPGSGIYAQ